MHSDPSTISRQIGHLVKLGLVERTADPVDGRATLLAATAEGLRVFEENRRLRNEKFAEILAGWSDEDRTALAATLARLTSSIESVAGTLAPPGGDVLSAPPPRPSPAATRP